MFSHLANFSHLSNRQRLHAFPLVGRGLYQAIILEVLDRLSDGRAAYVQLFGQGGLHQRSPRTELARDDCGAEALGDLHPKGRLLDWA